MNSTWAPDLLWIWPPSLGKTDKSSIEVGGLEASPQAICELARFGMMRWDHRGFGVGKKYQEARGLVAH